MSVKIITGHVLEALRGLPAGSVHTVVTSPPYWGLRDYGIEPVIWGGRRGHAHEWRPLVKSSGGAYATNSRKRWHGERYHRENDPLAYGYPQIPAGEVCSCGAWRGSLGLEPTPELYVRHLVQVMRAVRRVLHPMGTAWLNIGDCYATGGPADLRHRDGLRRDNHPSRGTPERAGRAGAERENRSPAIAPNRMRVKGLKPKDLVMLPARVALALQADGWWIRNDIIWAKKNCMPESVTDRCTKSHEYIYLLTKSERYYFDAVAIEEEQVEHERMRRLREQAEGLNSRFDLRRDQPHGQIPPGKNGVARSARARQELALKGTRNKRTVWHVGTKPFPEAHFATFPPELIEPCILAGTSEHGHCSACGKGYLRVVARAQAEGKPSGNKERKYRRDHGGVDGNLHRGNQAFAIPYTASTYRTTGWKPACACNAPLVPGLVLDPFAGAGTTGLVADRHGRDALLIELNEAYAQMARRRIEADATLFSQVHSQSMLTTPASASTVQGPA
jgi:DNA modification methylase